MNDHQAIVDVTIAYTWALDTKNFQGLRDVFAADATATLRGVECEGIELCEPCTTLEGMTEPGVIKAFVHRGGLNADILSDGEISVGDSVTPV